METLFIIIIIIFIICCSSSLIGAYLYTQSTPSNTQFTPSKTQSTPSNTQFTPSKVQSTPNNTQSTLAKKELQKYLDKCTITLKSNTCKMTKDGVYNVCSGIFPEAIEKGKKVINIGDKGYYSNEDDYICGEKYEETLRQFFLV
jgi:hypothetical protein